MGNEERGLVEAGPEDRLRVGRVRGPERGLGSWFA